MTFDDQITFLPVADLDRSAVFYGETLGLELAVDQGDCLIYRVAARAFLGVCLRPERAKPSGVIVTLVTADVDDWHERIITAGGICESPPAAHPDYGIYQAFYRDPDGHLLEIQRFDDPAWSAPR
jgi:catechol 2,3-dioxygenase-like lactoylglutathione lyase family enzyme